MRRSIAATAVAATTLGGAAVGATLLGPGLAGAQDGEDDTDQGTVEESSSAERLAEALQPLVDDGTIDESQRDAVVEQLESVRPLRRGPGAHRHGRLLGGPGVGADVAEILGLDPSEVADALRDGDSLADLAEANSVDPQELVDAIVAATEERLDDAVEAGRIDSDRAEEVLENAEERAEDLVNGELGARRFRFGRPGTLDDGGDSDPAA